MFDNRQNQGSQARGRGIDRGGGRGDGDSTSESSSSPPNLATKRGNTSSPSPHTEQQSTPKASRLPIKLGTENAGQAGWAKFAANRPAYDARRRAQGELVTGPMAANRVAGVDPVFEPTTALRGIPIIRNKVGFKGISTKTSTREEPLSSAAPSQPLVTTELSQETKNPDQIENAAQPSQNLESVPVILSEGEISAEQTQHSENGPVAEAAEVYTEQQLETLKPLRYNPEDSFSQSNKSNGPSNVQDESRNTSGRPGSFEQASIEHLTSQAGNNVSENQRPSVESHILAARKFLDERDERATAMNINSLAEGEITPTPGNTILSSTASKTHRLPRSNKRRKEEVQNTGFNSDKSSKKDKKRSALRNNVEALTDWIFKHPFLALTWLIVTSILLSRRLEVSHKPLFRQSVLPVQDLTNLQKTSLLRANQAEMELQSVITDNILSAQSNEGINHPCTAFLLDQIIETKPLLLSEQAALTFIYSNMLPRLQSIIFLPNISVHNLSSVYSDINQASQHLSSLDRQIMRHIQTQRVNSKKCVNIPGLSVQVPPRRFVRLKAPELNLADAIQSVLSYLNQFHTLTRSLPKIKLAGPFQPLLSHLSQLPTLARFLPKFPDFKLPGAIQHLLSYLPKFPNLALFLPASPIADNYEDASYSTPTLETNSKLIAAVHATPFDNHFRLIERNLQRSQRGHKGIRDELRRLESDVTTVAKAWFTKEQLLVITMSKTWMKRFLQAESEV